MSHENNQVPDNLYSHAPVMCREVLEYTQGALNVGIGLLVDCTLGEGGHSLMLLQNFQNLRIIGFERDSEILEHAKRRLRIYGNRMEFINDNYLNISSYINKYKNKISVFLYDFGISSFHYERSGRGFSFNKDEILDMRLNLDDRVNAYDIINNYSVKELGDLFWEYGEERFAKRIARVIGNRRSIKKIETSGELARLVLSAIPKKYHFKGIHPATRVFQAIRIVVNEELYAIEGSLKEACQYLAHGGRIIAISFHSLEDRIVKNRFKRLQRGCDCDEYPQYCHCNISPFVKILTRKPLLPTEDEVAINKRARSAKLRVCERL
ncbi:MAG: 16S rRNA (cytosine(1402)-N(4))-methyltransferase RsmH [Spirochaetota bacterium]|nr:16S rRNA (cytosine(1402)-N(4))-methyltransferase RsmH [Spirochaetota bacterium]